MESLLALVAHGEAESSSLVSWLASFFGVALLLDGSISGHFASLDFVSVELVVKLLLELVSVELVVSGLVDCSCGADSRESSDFS